MASEGWSSADRYEPFIGRWSRLVAREFVRWLEPTAGLRWLDVGCGTGALSEAVLAEAGPASLHGVDPSAAYVGRAAERLQGPRASFTVGAAQELPSAVGCIDRVVCGLVLNFVPDAAAAVREMRRVLVPGGVAAAYVWDYADGMQLLRRFWDAAIAEDPAAVALDEGERFPVCRRGALADCFTTAGMTEVRSRAIEVPTTFVDFDDYWTPFLGGQGPGPGYCASLDEHQRERLRSRLQTALPTGPDGSIRLTARAWAVQGTSV